MTEPTAPTPDDPLGIDTAGMGHNNPPEPLPYDAAVLTDLDSTAKRFVEVSDQWLKVDVTTETLAGQLGDQIDGLRKLFQKIEAARKDAKAPHLAAGTTVDEAFNPIKALVETSANKLKPRLAAYVQQKEREAEVERQRLADEARQAEQAARLAQMEAEKGDSIEAQVEADKAQETAKTAAKVAAKPISTAVKSASGAGRTISSRKRNHCTVTNVRHLFMHFQDNPKVHELLVSLANAEANTAGFPKDGKIPGVTIEEKTTVA
jgi:hypothetical protein